MPSGDKQRAGTSQCECRERGQKGPREAANRHTHTLLCHTERRATNALSAKVGIVLRS